MNAYGNRMELKLEFGRLRISQLKIQYELYSDFASLLLVNDETVELEAEKLGDLMSLKFNELVLTESDLVVFKS